MKIQAEVSLFVQLADGRRVSVSYTVNRTAGDNPAYAAGAALDALTEAQTAALRGFAAQVHPDAPEAAPEQRGRSVEEWREAAGVKEPPQTEADLLRKLRDYTVNAMDTVDVPLLARPAEVRAALESAGLKTYATDMELESFQALRRQTQNGPER